VRVKTGAWGAVTVALSLATTAAPAQAAPKLHDGQSAFKVRPATILVSGDGTAWLGGKASGENGHYGRIRWRTFRRSGALAHGRIFITECEPDCAGGRRWSAKAVIRARRVRHGHFTRLSARYRNSGRSVTARWRLQVNSPTYAYWVSVGS
jgi:hypothetical protein